jgi:hypothetical protein
LIPDDYYFDMETYLTDIEQNSLRQRSVISSTEVAKRIGDLIIAEDVTTGMRRVIDQSSIISETANRKVLKG